MLNTYIEENICAYTLENFLVLTYSDDMTDANDNDLQDSGHIEGGVQEYRMSLPSCRLCVGRIGFRTLMYL